MFEFIVLVCLLVVIAVQHGVVHEIDHLLPIAVTAQREDLRRALWPAGGGRGSLLLLHHLGGRYDRGREGALHVLVTLTGGGGIISFTEE